MSIAPLTFSEKWEITFSEKTECNHLKNASYYHMLTVAVVVSSLALFLSPLIFPAVLPYLTFSSPLLMLGLPMLARHFQIKESAAKGLATQARNIRSIYAKNTTSPKDKARAEAFHDHWKAKALEAETSMKKLFNKSAPCLMEDKVRALDQQKMASILKIQSVFLEVLLEDENLFQEFFLRHGADLPFAISEFATWDSREAIDRALDSQLNKNDILLTFNSGQDILDIHYKQVFPVESNQLLKNRFLTAFRAAV